MEQRSTFHREQRKSHFRLQQTPTPARSEVCQLRGAGAFHRQLHRTPPGMDPGVQDSRHNHLQFRLLRPAYGSGIAGQRCVPRRVQNQLGHAQNESNELSRSGRIHSSSLPQRMVDLTGGVDCPGKDWDSTGQPRTPFSGPAPMDGLFEASIVITA